MTIAASRSPPFSSNESGNSPRREEIVEESNEPKGSSPSSDKPVVGLGPGKVPPQPGLVKSAPASQPKTSVPLTPPPAAHVPKPMDPEERFKVVYGEMGNQIRHFSTVRSSLTTFLITVSLAAFVANANRATPSSYLIYSGMILMLMAIAVCFIFSYRTEKHVLRYKDFWNWAKDTSKPFPDGRKCRFEFLCVLYRMIRDPMNWLVLLAAYVVIKLLNVPWTSFPLRQLLPW